MKPGDIMLAATIGIALGTILERWSNRKSRPYIIEATLSLDNGDDSSEEKEERECAHCGKVTNDWAYALYDDEKKETLFFCSEGCLETYILYGSSLRT